MVICEVCGQEYDNENIPVICCKKEVLFPETVTTRKPLVQCGRDGESYTIHIDGKLVGKYATPEMMQVNFAGVLADAKESGTLRKLALKAENAIFEALASSGDPISKDTETWLNAAAMLIRRAIEST